MKRSFPVILQTWETKSGAGMDPRPFWTWWSLIYKMLSANFLLNMRIFLSYPFPDRFTSYIVCVCNHYRRTNHNCRSMMGLTNHLSWVYDILSSYHVFFSLMTSLKMMGLGLAHMVRGFFHFALKFRWSCQWRRLWRFCFDWNQVIWWWFDQLWNRPLLF